MFRIILAIIVVCLIIGTGFWWYKKQEDIAQQNYYRPELAETSLKIDKTWTSLGDLYQRYMPRQVLQFLVTEPIKRPDTKNRAVKTGSESEPFWIDGGYRAFYVSAGTLPFLKIHSELIPADRWLSNIAVLEKQYQLLGLDPKSSFRKNKYREIEYYIAGNPADKNQVKEAGAIMFPKDSMIVTIYFLYQGTDAKDQDYNPDNVHEYETLRDQFIENYINKILD